jgi:uncharacterized protein (DUF302 family)
MQVDLEPRFQEASVLDFRYSRETKLDIATVIARLKESLVGHGFGVLWELDVPAKLKEKGVNYDGDHHILEVCNPHDAKTALEANPDIAYFLPCKIVVYRVGERTTLGMPRPTFFMNSLGGGDLSALAERVEGELQAAIDAV